MSNSIEELIQRALQPGERVLWSGRTHDRFAFNYGMVFAFLFSLVFIGVMLVEDVYDRDDGSVSAPDDPILIVFVVGFCIAFIKAIPSEQWYRGKLAYGLTDQRALIVGGPFYRIHASMPLEYMKHVRLQERRDRRGTIIFEDFCRPCGEDGDDECPQEFFDIEEAQTVFELIRNAQAKTSATHPEILRDSVISHSEAS